MLRDMSRLDDSLAAYDEAVKRFSEQPGIRCGRAGVLAELGRLDEAISEYWLVVKSESRERLCSIGRGRQADKPDT